MTAEVKPVNRKIANTDIFVFGYAPDTDTFTYSRPFSQEEAEGLAKATNTAIETQYKGATGLRQGLTARDCSLINMSTLKGIVANSVLMDGSQGKRWLPTLEEGLALHEAGMLAPDVLIDFGTALYDGENPDSKITQAMMETARAKGYETPVLASFTSLGLSKDGERYGVTPQLVSDKGLITGQEAVKALENFRHVGNSGVRRVYRDDVGNWNADWYVNLDNFYGYCRVGRFSAEGNAKKLREEALGAFAPIQKSVDTIVSSARSE